MIPALLAGWHGLGPETKGAIIQAVATLLAAGVGVVAILNQIRSQAKQNRERIPENEKRTIKSQLFPERQSVVSGKRVSVRVDLGGPRILKQTKKNKQHQ